MGRPGSGSRPPQLRAHSRLRPPRVRRRPASRRLAHWPRPRSQLSQSLRSLLSLGSLQWLHGPMRGRALERPLRRPSSHSAPRIRMDGGPARLAPRAVETDTASAGVTASAIAMSTWRGPRGRRPGCPRPASTPPTNHDSGRRRTPAMQMQGDGPRALDRDRAPDRARAPDSPLARVQRRM